MWKRFKNTFVKYSLEASSMLEKFEWHIEDKIQQLSPKFSYYMKRYIRVVENIKYLRLLNFGKIYIPLLLTFPITWVILTQRGITVLIALFWILFFLIFFLVLFGLACSASRTFDLIGKISGISAYSRMVAALYGREKHTKASIQESCIMLVVLLVVVTQSLFLIHTTGMLYIAGFSILGFLLFPFIYGLNIVAREAIFSLISNMGVWIACFVTDSTFDGSFRLIYIMYYAAAVAWTFGYRILRSGARRENVNLLPMLKLYDIVWNAYTVACFCLVICGIFFEMNFVFYLLLAIATYVLHLQAGRVRMKHSYITDFSIGLLFTAGFLIGKC